MRMIRAANVCAQQIAATWMDLMKKMDALKVCDDPIERDLAERFGLGIAVAEGVVKLGDSNRLTRVGEE